MLQLPRKGRAGLKHLATRQSLARSACTGVRELGVTCGIRVVSGQWSVVTITAEWSLTWSFLTALTMMEMPLMAVWLPRFTSSAVRMWHRSDRLLGLNLTCGYTNCCSVSLDADTN